MKNAGTQYQRKTQKAGCARKMTARPRLRTWEVPRDATGPTGRYSNRSILPILRLGGVMVEPVKWPFGPLNQLMLVFAGVYLASLTATLSIGLHPVLPWGLTLVLVLAGVPFAVIFSRYSERKTSRLWEPAAAIGVVYFSNNFYLWIIAALLLLLLTDAGKIRWQWNLMGMATLVIALGYASLWNCNYLLARFVPPRHDAALRAFDLWFYSLFTTTPVSYAGLFPVLHNPFALRLLHNAYAILFLEIVMVVFLLCQSGNPHRVSRFLTGLFTLYLFGVISFVVYPALGPFLFYPESIGTGAGASLQFIDGIRHDYYAAVNGGALQGYGYFISIPSLHVMVSLFLQHSLAAHPVLFKLFLPINGLLILSTFLLGYHYVLDVAAAGAITGVWLYFFRYPFFRYPARPRARLAGRD